MAGDESLSHSYNQSYSRKQIDAVLDKIKRCVEHGKYTISLNENRQENIDFINEYNLTSKKQRQILLEITTDDFCHSLKNKKQGFEHETLYVFTPEVLLKDADGNTVSLYVYTKFNIIETRRGNFTVIISFHKLNRPIQFAFKTQR